MPITNAQTVLFFEANDQMAIPRPVLAHLQNEGTTMIDYLAEFDKETLQQIADNLRRLGCRAPDPNYVPPSPMHALAPSVPTMAA